MSYILCTGRLSSILGLWRMVFQSILMGVLRHELCQLVNVRTRFLRGATQSRLHSGRQSSRKLPSLISSSNLCWSLKPSDIRSRFDFSDAFNSSFLQYTQQFDLKTHGHLQSRRGNSASIRLSIPILSAWAPLKALWRVRTTHSISFLG